MTGAKKFTFMKNQFLHARQPREEIFEFCSCSGIIFMPDFWNFTRLFPNCVTLEAVLIKTINVPQAYVYLPFDALSWEWNMDSLKYVCIACKFTYFFSDTGQWIGVCNVGSRKRITSISKGCAEIGVNFLKIQISLLQIDLFIGIKSLPYIPLSGYVHM